MSGLPMVARFKSFTGMAGIAAASVDNPSRHKPDVGIYSSSVQPWDYLGPNLFNFAHVPESRE